MKSIYLIIIMTVMLNLTTWSLNYMSISIFMNCNILSSSLSGQVIWTKMLIRNWQKNIRKKSSRYFIRYHWLESIKQEFLWFLFKDFWVLQPIIFQNIIIIRYCNQLSTSFLSALILMVIWRNLIRQPFNLSINFIFI